MLTVNVKTGLTNYNDSTHEFVYETYPVELEHSLLTVSQWEAKYKKPFLSDLERHAKTDEETVDYVRMMVIDKDLPVTIFERLIHDNLKEVLSYISDTQSATTISEFGKKSNASEIITSEVIYYWMFSNQIDKECEQWPLNRLITLIRVFAAKSSKPEKMSKSDIIAQNKALNAQRKAKLKTKG